MLLVLFNITNVILIKSVNYLCNKSILKPYI